MRSKSIHHMLIVVATTSLGGLLVAGEHDTPRFRADDPVLVDSDTALDASGAVRRPLGRYADFVMNTLASDRDVRPIRALDVNTLDDVPRSSWFEHRISTGTMSLEAIVRGPDRVARLEVDRWIIVQGKDTGRQPGFRAIDASDPTRHLYQIEFDSRSNPEMATGAEIIGTAIYYAVGYNVVENYLIDLDLSKVSIAPTATIREGGRERPFTRRDLETMLRDVRARPNGHYRASASRYADGKYLGPFRYYGTRPDDPNDRIPHEHRRVLRANRVFAAWLNHDDSRAGNSLDMLIGDRGQRYLKHYMFDFGSTLGSGTREQDHPWVGHEYVLEPKPGLLTLASFGMWRRPYIAVKAPSSLPAAGNFTADGFEPTRWKPHYPNLAFMHMQPEDAFWGAQIVASFSPDKIARIVAKAQFSDPRVSDWVTATLLRRRDRVLRAWLMPLNPIVRPRIDGEMLMFENAAELAGLAAGSSYEASWSRFDNVTGRHVPVGGRLQCAERQVPVPLEALGEAAFVAVELRAINAEHPSWQQPLRVYFRRVGDAWTTVGVVGRQ